MSHLTNNQSSVVEDDQSTLSLEPYQPRQTSSATLLPHIELTVERFAKWIALNDKFDGLAWAVARRMSVPVQLQPVTSPVEGLACQRSLAAALDDDGGDD